MFCYTLPSVDNVNPKQLVLYVANSMQWYFPTGLIGGGLDAPMPNEAESCVLAQVSAGLKSGKEYTVRLEQYPSVLVSANLWLAKARVRIAAYSNYQDSLKLRIKWAVTPGAARAKDVIKVIDSQGNVVDWCAARNRPASFVLFSSVFFFLFLCVCSSCWYVSLFRVRGTRVRKTAMLMLRTSPETRAQHHARPTCA